MSGLRQTLRAAAIAASVTAVTIFLLNPPSLSGAEDLLAIVVGAVALVLLTAWATVVLSGSDPAGEREFERVVNRSERLARQPLLAEHGTEFEVLVADAIDRLPEDFQRLLEDTPVVVSRRGGEAGAYGHYFGDTVAREHHEDRIVLYQDTLERDFGHDPDLLRAEVTRTVRHELAHHLGADELGVRDLGL